MVDSGQGCCHPPPQDAQDSPNIELSSPKYVELQLRNPVLDCMVASLRTIVVKPALVTSVFLAREQTSRK